MKCLCECGCGGEVNIYRGKPNRFIQGHNTRGKKLSEEHKEAIRQGNLNKIVTKETRQKLRDASTGRTFSKESKEKMSLSHIGQIPNNAWKPGHIPWNKGIKMPIEVVIKNMTGKNDDYCDIWADKEYVNDLRGPACEICGITNMMSIKLFGNRLSTHHKNGKENCAPDDISTLCCSCHMKIHAANRGKE